MKAITEDQRQLKEQVRKEAENWADKFNFIQLEVVNKMLECDGAMLIDYIEQEEPDYADFLNNYNLESEYKEYCKDNDEEPDEDNLKQFCEDHQNFDGYKDDQTDRNYPMWNTLFEFKEKPSDTMIQACKDAGFGVVNQTDYFNVMLFVASAGYSFYGAHWIPAYLNMPWNTDLKAKCKGISFDDM